jgi:hypothetical protein
VSIKGLMRRTWASGLGRSGLADRQGFLSSSVNEFARPDRSAQSFALGCEPIYSRAPGPVMSRIALRKVEYAQNQLPGSITREAPRGTGRRRTDGPRR